MCPQKTSRHTTETDSSGNRRQFPSMLFEHRTIEALGSHSLFNLESTQ
jgi:hypothetical protein